MKKFQAKKTKVKKDEIIRALKAKVKDLEHRVEYWKSKCKKCK